MVEDGLGIPGAGSYASVAELAGYRSVTGVAVPVGTVEAALEVALRAGTAYLEYRYAWLWPGVRRSMEQGLSWPRAGAMDRDGYALVGVPAGLVRATCEAALMELVRPGMLWESLNANGTIRAESEGGVRKEYERGMPGVRAFGAIHAQVVSFLVCDSGVRVERG
jgi:hypothetical protein